MAFIDTLDLSGLRIFGLSITTKSSPGLLGFIRKLKDITQPAKRRKLMLALAETGRNIVKGNFDAGGRPTRWAPKKIVRGQTSRTTAGAKGGRPLIITGELRDTFQIRANANEADVFTNLIKAPSLHFGGMVGRNRATFLPARPYLLIPESEVKQMERVAGLALLFG